jgi:hypothetical protein
MERGIARLQRRTVSCLQKRAAVPRIVIAAQRSVGEPFGGARHAGQLFPILLAFPLRERIIGHHGRTLLHHNDGAIGTDLHALGASLLRRAKSTGNVGLREGRGPA